MVSKIRCVYALELGGLYARAFDIRDNRFLSELYRPLPGGVISSGTLHDAKSLSRELKDARRELSAQCQARTVEVTLTLPAQATVEKFIVTPHAGPAATLAAVRADFGPVLNDPDLFALRWGRAGDGPDAGSMVVCASICPRGTVEDYVRALEMSGAPTARSEPRIEPFVAGVLALCPVEGRACAISLDDTGLWHVWRTQDGKPQDEDLYYTGILGSIPPRLLDDLARDPDLPVMLVNISAEAFPEGTLAPGRLVVCDCPRCVDFPVNFGASKFRSRALPALAALLLILQVTGLSVSRTRLQTQLAAVRDATQRAEAAIQATAAHVPEPDAEQQPGTTMRWPAVYEHISAVAGGLSLASVEIPRGQVGSDRGTYVIATGSGDLDRILTFESDVVSGPVKSAALVSLTRRGGALAFRAQMEWRP